MKITDGAALVEALETKKIEGKTNVKLRNVNGFSELVVISVICI